MEENCSLSLYDVNQLPYYQILVRNQGNTQIPEIARKPQSLAKMNGEKVNPPKSQTKD